MSTIQLVCNSCGLLGHKANGMTLSLLNYKGILIILSYGLGQMQKDKCCYDTNQSPHLL